MNFKVREHLIDYTRESYVTDDGSSIEEGFVDCSLGINPLGYPEIIDDARKDFYNNYRGINQYPDFPYNQLKKLLIEYWKDISDLKLSNIKIGCGSMGIIANINKMFIDSGSKALGFCPQFSDFITEVKCCNGIYDYISLKQEKSYRFDSIEFLNAINNDYRLIYIDNPNNPTGQVIPLSVIEEIVKKARELNICVFVDEAYGDYMDKENSAIRLVNDYDNLLVARSFSKGFGLASFRVGYLITSEILGNYYSKIDWPFTVSTHSQYIVSFALKDNNFLNESRKKIKAIKEKIINSCSKLRVSETDMEVPIMVLEHPDENVNLFEEFKKRGIISEPGEAYIGLDKNAVRFRVSKEVEEIVKIIKDIEETL